MRLLGKKKLEKLKQKNKGNVSLTQAIDQLILDVEKSDWKNENELKAARKEADCVHSDGFYFLISIFTVR